MLKSKSILFLDSKWILNCYFPFLGFLFFFISSEINFFLSVVNLFFVLIPITRRPDIEAKNKYYDTRIFLFVSSLLNFLVPAFMPLCLQQISNLTPEDFVDSYSTTNKKFLFNHGRLSFNILFHSCFFCIFGEMVLLSLIISLCINEYLVPAIKKISLGNKPYDWLFQEKIGYLHYWSRKYGWANFLPENSSLKLCKFLNENSIIFNFGCLFFELFGIAMVFSNYSKDLWCYGTVLFHAVVFLTTGILFWQNMILIYLVTFLNNYNSLLVCLFCLLLIDKSKTRPLGWFSTRLCEKIEIVGLLEDGSEMILANNIFGARERTLGIRGGRVLLNGNFRTFHIGEADYENKNIIESSNVKNYEYKFKLDLKWLKYFKKFIQYTKNPEQWIWENIIPEGQIFYTQKNKYRFEKPLKNIKFVLKVWYLDHNYKEHLIEERSLKTI